MHTDARQIDNHSLIEGDVCIIGAGAAGITMAMEWIGTSHKVILLEGGGFDYDDRVQELYRGKVTGQPYYPLKSARLHYFGGTTGHWGGLCSTFDPLAFTQRDWINESGWPFPDTDMSDYYKRAHSVLQLGDYQFGLDYWQKQNPSLIPLPLDKEFFRTKIWRYGMPTAMKFGTTFRSTVVNAPNIHLYTYANVVDMRANENVSAINEITVKNYAGKTCTVRAKYFVMACCAIQNSRLLMACNNQRPKGLGNDNDLVGRYFMENIEVKSAELWLKKKSALQLYMRNAPNVTANLAISPKKQAEHRILNGMCLFTPLETARKTPPYIQTWTEDDPRKNRQKESDIYDEAHKTTISGLFDSGTYDAFQVTMRLEQAPNPLSRVTLSAEKDEFGIPRADLHWEFTDLEKTSMLKIYELLGKQVGAADIGRIRLKECIADKNDSSMPASTSAGWHHMGTTKMNNDPKKGVVDADCKVHGLANLYIASSSCFPNGAAVNPTYTIVALSLRVTDHLKDKIKKEGNNFV